MFDILHSLFFLSKILYSNLSLSFTEIGHFMCPVSSSKETFYEDFQLVKNLTTHLIQKEVPQQRQKCIVHTKGTLQC